MSLFKSIHPSSFWSVAFTSVACLLGATPAPAADPGAPRSETVSYRDLNLSTIEGATALYQRIRHAANSVCDEPGAGVARYQQWKSCYQAAIADAVAKVNSPLLTSVHGGKNKESTATAMNSK
jgi:UrcA family protein